MHSRAREKKNMYILQERADEGGGKRAKKTTDTNRCPPFCKALFKKIIHRAAERLGEIGKNGNIGVADLTLPF